MVKNYLSKFLLVCVLLFPQLTSLTLAEENFSDLYIKITDATTAIKTDDQQHARQLLGDILQQFKHVENANSEAGKKVQQLLEDKQEKVTKEQLVKISSALLAFEKEQHPVDVEAEKHKLQTKLADVLSQLEQSIQQKDLAQVKNDYKKFNMIWTSNEGIVRDTSTAYYGKIETAISFLRSSLETEPADFSLIESNYQDLTSILTQFIQGEHLDAPNKQYTLSEGIQLLQEGYTAFQQKNVSEGKTKIKTFIEIWPTIEGDIRTRDARLYTKVESQLPVIMIKGEQEAYQLQLQQLIVELSQIDTNASYSFIDAMLILLREGIEALLIVMSLVSTLKAAKQSKGLPWVYGGAILGIALSVIIAIALQQLFPTIASGTQREVLEGIVGVLAVIMMITIGIWLHKKSSVKTWNAFMDKQMNRVLSTSSFISMFFLSFLAVFREGAETILFYAGILPKITLSSLLLGIGAACVTLVVIAYIMMRASKQFAPYKLFFILTWFIYFLAFKMLGVSIHALQFTNVLPTHMINGLLTIEWLGFYPTIETLGSQLLFIIIIIVVMRRQDKS